MLWDHVNKNLPLTAHFQDIRYCHLTKGHKGNGLEKTHRDIVVSDHFLLSPVLSLVLLCLIKIQELSGTKQTCDSKHSGWEINEELQDRGIVLVFCAELWDIHPGNYKLVLIMTTSGTKLDFSMFSSTRFLVNCVLQTLVNYICAVHLNLFLTKLCALKGKLLQKHM